jgi:hypothetical protein
MNCLCLPSKASKIKITAPPPQHITPLHSGTGTYIPANDYLDRRTKIPSPLPLLPPNPLLPPPSPFRSASSPSCDYQGFFIHHPSPSLLLVYCTPTTTCFRQQDIAPPPPPRFLSFSIRPHICTVHRNENPIYIFLFWELRGLSPNVHVASVAVLWIRSVQQLFFYQVRSGSGINCFGSGSCLFDIKTCV